MSSNQVLTPQLIPWITAILLLFLHRRIIWQRAVSGVSAVIALANAAYLLHCVLKKGTLVFWAGDWLPPFGITMVADTFSALLVLLTAIIETTCIFYSFSHIDAGRERHFYYFLLQMMLVGCNGAFVAGDIFNLYVWFEILLLSSYVLLALGGEKGQLRETLPYAVLNILASTFFLVGLGLLYGITGTLNMADLAVKLPQIQNRDLVDLIAVIFLFVFGSKAAIFPLFYWLPHSYAQPPAAVSAIFGGLLTKVGVYCLIRTFTLLFAGVSAYIYTLLYVLGAATMVLGGLGAIYQYQYRKILSFSIISQVGYMVLGLAMHTVLSIAAAIYFLFHNILVKTSLFYFAGATEEISGTGDLKQMSGLIHRFPLLAWGFFLGGISLAGVPPFSGFFAKLLLLQSAAESGDGWAMFFTLAVGFLTLFYTIKIFMHCYWGEEKSLLPLDAAGNATYRRKLASPLLLVALSLAAGLASAPVTGVVLQAAAEISDPGLYIQAVFGQIY
ncbi:MAG: Na+/H+ antiporter subunit D [Firmicutes bacterium]|nr:Na+/H+ antiporter subunit D [Bacillota bacterium]